MKSITIQTIKAIVLIVNFVIFRLHFFQTCEKMYQFWNWKAAFLPLQERRRSVCGAIFNLILYLVIFPFPFSKIFRCLINILPLSAINSFVGARGSSGVPRNSWRISWMSLPYERSPSCQLGFWDVWEGRRFERKKTSWQLGARFFSHVSKWPYADLKLFWVFFFARGFSFKNPAAPLPSRRRFWRQKCREILP